MNKIDINFGEIIKVYLSDNFSLSVEIGPVILIIVVVCFALLFMQFVLKWVKLGFRHDVELNVSLGGMGGMKIKPNHMVEQIAHKAWTELITRKAGLLFDVENDTIVEIYDSWYVLFGEMRSLIKEIPANQIKDENTQRLVNLLVVSLNRGLRPHLTKWQAKFRRWYKNESKKNKDKTPQEIQKEYHQYDDLVQDLTMINQQLVSYANELKKLIL